MAVSDYLFFQSAGFHRSPLCYAWWWRWSWPHWASSPSPLSSSGSRNSLETVIYMLYIQSYSFGWILTPKGGKGNPAQMTSMTLFSAGDCLDVVIIHLMDTWNTSFWGHFSWTRITRHKKSRTRCFMEALNTATLVFHRQLSVINIYIYVYHEPPKPWKEMFWPPKNQVIDH